MNHRTAPTEAQRVFERELITATTLATERFGEAVSAHFSSYEELKKVSNYKVNPQYERQNLQQQSGFSSEIKEVSRRNAESSIRGETGRIARTDNVGQVNHQTYDFVAVDSKTGLPLTDGAGKFIRGEQMKVHQDVEKYRYLYKNAHCKYASADLVLPVDQFDSIMSDWASQEESLLTQVKHLQAEGKAELAAVKKQELEQLRDTRSRTKKSHVSTEDAMDARTRPGMSVLKDTLGVVHRAGLDAAKNAAAIGLVTSGASHLTRVYQGKASAADAAVGAAGDVGRAAGLAYASSAASASLSGALRSANKQVLQNLGKGGTPAMIVQAASLLGKGTIDLVSGKITAEEFANQLTRESALLATSLTGSNLGAIIGTVVLPGAGTIVGGFVGGMVASIMSNALYGALQASMDELKYSRDALERTRAICAYLRAEHQVYRAEMHTAFDIFFAEMREQMKVSFDTIEDSLAKGESIHSGLVGVAQAFGIELAFDSSAAFSEHLRSGSTLKL